MPAKRYPSVRSLLMTTTPNAPFALRPTHTELLTLVALLADSKTPDNEAWLIATAHELTEREVAYRQHTNRVDALRKAVISHDRKVTPQGQARLVSCKCASCVKWRAELGALYEDKKAKGGVFL